MKEFLKDLEEELVNLEKSTRPPIEHGMFAKVKDLANRGKSLAELDPKMRSLTDNLLIKYNIIEPDESLSKSVTDLFHKICRDRVSN